MLEEGKEHGGLLIFGESLVLAVFHHAYYLRPVAAPELEVPANGAVDGAKDLARKFAINDGHDRRLVIIVHREGATGQHRGPSGTEVSG
jgi:hypothetical protein